MMEKYESMQEDGNVIPIAEMIERGEASYKGSLKRSYEKGKNEGLKVGKIGLLSSLIKQKYQEEAGEWLSSLSEQELDKAVELILTCETLDKLKKLIL